MLKSFKFELSVNVSEKDASLVDQSLPEHGAAFRSRNINVKGKTESRLLHGERQSGAEETNRSVMLCD